MIETPKERLIDALDYVHCACLFEMQEPGFKLIPPRRGPELHRDVQEVLTHLLVRRLCSIIVNNVPVDKMDAVTESLVGKREDTNPHGSDGAVLHDESNVGEEEGSFY